MSETDGLAVVPAETVVNAPAPDPVPAADDGPVSLDVPKEAPPDPTPEDTKDRKIDATDPEASGGKDVTPDDDGERKKIPGSQKLKRRLQLIEADYEAANARAADLEKKLAQFNTPQPEQGRPGVEREPKETDFPNDYLAFERATVAWNSRQAVREEFARLQQSHQEEQTQRQRREEQIERQEAYEESAGQARERIPDFDKVINSASDIKITNPELIEEIMSSPKAALIHYYLAQNRETARELNALKGKELAREVGRLEARVHLPQAKKATEASPPPSAPKGGAAPPFNLHDADINSYVAHRKKQIEAAR
jgi:hypothetical protein